MSEFQEISPNVFASLETGNVFSFTDRSYSKTDPKTLKHGNHEVIQWGSDNLLPYFNRQVLADNDIKQNLVNTDVDILAGQHLFLYRQRIQGDQVILEPIQDSELQDWMEEWEIHEKYSETLQDIKEFGNSWPEFILSRDKSTITSITSLDAVDCRLDKIKKVSGRIDSANLLVSDWKNTRYGKREIESVPLLSRNNPDISKIKGFKFAYHVKKRISGMPYYSLVEWYGTKDWTEIANIIPKFHLQGLKNGYMLRYHIKIPVSYFDRINKPFEEAKKDLKDELDRVLSGAENAQKAFFSFIDDKTTGMPGQVKSEFKIEKIETELKDESYLKLHEAASKIHARGHNIDPVLAGIHTEGRLSAGSEIKNLLNFHIAYKTPRIRRIAMKPFNLVKDYNFPDKKDIKIGIKDIDFTTLDESTTGMQEEPKPIS